MSTTDTIVLFSPEKCNVHKYVERWRVNFRAMETKVNVACMCIKTPIVRMWVQCFINASDELILMDLNMLNVSFEYIVTLIKNWATS